MNIGLERLHNASFYIPFFFGDNGKGEGSGEQEALFILGTKLFVLGSSLLVAILSFIFQRGYFGKGRKEKFDENGMKLKTLEDIAYRSHFPKWMRVPSLIDGLTSFILVRRHGINVLDNWIEEWKPICRVGVGIGDCVIVGVPSIVQKFLNSSDPNLLQKPKQLYDLIFQGPMRQGLISSGVDVWTPHRKSLNGAFSYNTLPTYLHLVNKHSKRMIKELSTPDKKVEGSPVHESIYLATMRMVLGVLVGSHPEIEAESEKMYTVSKDTKQMLIYRVLNPQNLFPPWWWLNFKQRWKFEKAYGGMQSGVAKIINICKTKLSLSEEKKGGEGRMSPFMSEMIRCNASDKEIFSQVITFLAAGQDTSVVTTAFLLQNLAENPQFQKECQREIDFIFNLKADPSDIDLTMDDLANLKYLERCILETLRLLPPLPLIFRQLGKDAKVAEWWFPKGTMFCFSLWGIHRCTDYYPNPKQFNPDRFLPEEIKKRPNSVFLPFSLGPRNCIGYKFAMMKMKIVMARLLHKFNVSSNSRLKDVKILYEVNINPEEELQLILTDRQAE